MTKGYTLREVSNILGVHHEVLREWARMGLLPALRSDGGTTLISERHLQTIQDVLNTHGRDGLAKGAALEMEAQ